MSNAKTSGGIGFVGLLAIAFIVLKLAGVIDWSWWLVLMPLLAPAILVLVVGVGVFAWVCYTDRRRKRR